MATTKLLNDAGMSPNTPIASYLPDYWSKGPNVDQITFANLLTHTSGLDYGVGSSASDFLFMKDQIAAGTTHLGQFWYQNMNFGLCRILISTINGNISPSLIVPAHSQRAQRLRRVLGRDHPQGLSGLCPRERVRSLRGDRSDTGARNRRRPRLQLPGIRPRVELG